MQRRETRPLSKHTLNLYEGQFDRLQTLQPRLGAAKVIRTLVDDFIRSNEEQAAQKFERIPLSSIPIEEILK